MLSREYPKLYYDGAWHLFYTAISLGGGMKSLRFEAMENKSIHGIDDPFGFLYLGKGRSRGLPEQPLHIRRLCTRFLKSLHVANGRRKFVH